MPKNFTNRISTIESEALELLDRTRSENDLEKWRIEILGRRGQITRILRGISELDSDARQAAGAAANQLKIRLQTAFEDSKARINSSDREVAGTGTNNAIDVTLPGRKVNPGSLHPTTQIIREISNAFNDYFCEIAKKLKDNSTHIVNSDTPQFRDKRVENSIFLSDCSTTEIEDIVKSLNNKSTSDTAVVALKYVSTSISSTLSSIINTSFLQGVFPDELKLAKVIPIHKTGKKTNVSNYRPISLLSVFSNFFEKAMHKRLYDFFSHNETI